MTITLPKMEQWQQDVYDSVVNDDGNGKKYVVVSRRQIGKTTLAIFILITFAFQKKCTSVVVEPVSHQSRRVFKDILSMLEGSGLVKSANASLLTIEFVNGSEILFKSAEQEDSLRGMTVSGLLVIDEAAFIKDEIFDILYPTTDVHNAPILIISTPLFRDGRFYELYTNVNNITFSWSEYDTSKYLSEDKLEEYRKTVPDMKFRSEYLGQFIDDGGFVFTNIQNSIGTPLGSPVYAGVDWGSGNDGDYTVVTLLNENGDVVGIESFKDKDAVEQVRLIAQLINSTQTLKRVQVELNSIGRVFYDNLKNAVSRKSIITGFTTTNESKRRIIEQLVEAFQKNLIKIPDDAELKKELKHYAVQKTQKGYTYNGLGAHDDYVMSLAIGYDLIRGGGGNYNISFGTQTNRKISLSKKYG